jgi:hypothetical protein
VTQYAGRMDGSALDRRRYLPWLAAALFACAGAVLLIYFGRAARPMWLDEEMIALNIRSRGFVQLAGPLWLGQAAPLGWLDLVRASLLAFGTSERALRVVPVLFGIGTLATAFWVGRRWLSPVGAATLVLLCAFGDHLWFFSLELKHYSADAFGGLLVPALAAAAIETPASDATGKIGRRDLWWLTAGVVQWFSYGALLVMPPCALVMTYLTARQDGWRAALRSARFGVVWLLFVALHYAWSARYVTGSEYLHSYWASGFPPGGAGIAATLTWLAGRLQPLAFVPGGTTLWPVFWIIVVIGLIVAVRTRLALGLILTGVLVSAFVWAAIRVVPLSGRLSLWIAPALYAAIAFASDGLVNLWRASRRRASSVGLAAAVVCALPVLWVCADVVRTCVVDMATRPRATAHGLDDRAAVRWLMTQREPGEPILTTHLTLPAIWWYGDAALSTSGAYLPDGGQLFEISQESKDVDCPTDRLRAALAGVGRAAIYLGFDMPDGFDDLSLNRLSELGALTTYRRFGDAGHAALVDLRLPPSGRFVVPRQIPADPDVRPAGCVGIKVAERW